MFGSAKFKFSDTEYIRNTGPTVCLLKNRSSLGPLAADLEQYSKFHQNICHLDRTSRFFWAACG